MVNLMLCLLVNIFLVDNIWKKIICFLIYFISNFDIQRWSSATGATQLAEGYQKPIRAGNCPEVSGEQLG